MCVGTNEVDVIGSTGRMFCTEGKSVYSFSFAGIFNA